MRTACATLYQRMTDVHPLWVIILRPWPDTPVYHRLGPPKRSLGFVVEYTGCGREIGTYVPSFPRKHAVKFARPCKGCFPA